MATRPAAPPVTEKLKNDGDDVSGKISRRTPLESPKTKPDAAGHLDLLMNSMETNVETLLEGFVMLQNKIEENVSRRETYNPSPLANKNEKKAGRPQDKQRGYQKYDD